MRTIAEATFISASFSQYKEKEVKKIANLLHLISKHHGGIFLTKLIKLLYVIDEMSIMEIGVPVSPLEYNVAKNGPLPVNIWSDLSSYNHTFSEYINVEYVPEHDGLYISSANIDTDRKLFSEYEIDLIEKTVKKHKKSTVNELINYTHRKGSPWKKIVDEKNIDFKKEKSLITKHKINFSEFLEDDLKKYFFDTYLKTRLI